MTIKLDRVTKRLGDKTILNDVTKVFSLGNIYLIKGESGAGKTSLLEICAGLQNIDNGQVIVEKNKKFGFVFQNFNVFEELTVYDNLFVDLLMTTNYNKSEIENIIIKTIGELGLTDKIKQKAKLLSGGEKQRLALARAIVKKNDIIFADEPSANIDEKNVEKIKRIFEKMKNDNSLIIIAAHDESFDCIADEILRLRGGKLICE
ncbi:ATP-binding cassette domain-containing protein [Lachnospira multipara]|uniref:Putative ABC transport system ATP-binding protein n=1 Tax=Lachnospira multipara TaxID=28051 RepID=A0A1H5V3M9_9FIRM|nr:ATP-binding cassette domain-containing protein [Lachnospira multipara]SEF81806.1 putative ABC transport system ATP-binding protein [Lachnospira multipara]